MKKSKAEPQGTLFDKAEGRLKLALADLEAANEAARERLAGFLEERAKIEKRIEDLEGRAAKMAGEYRVILAELRSKEKAAVEAGSITEKDVRAGKLSLREYMVAGTSQGQILEKALEAAAQKMTGPRKAVRELRFQALEGRAELRRLDEKIIYQKTGAGSRLYSTLKILTEELERAGVKSGTAEGAKFIRQEADNSLALARGVVLFHAASWTLRSAAEVEDLELDPIIQPAHFDGLRKIAEELKAQVFETVTLNYSPGPGHGHNAGDFWYSVRPKNE